MGQNLTIKPRRKLRLVGRGGWDAWKKYQDHDDGKKRETNCANPGKNLGLSDLGGPSFFKKLCRDAVFGPKNRLDAPNANHWNASKFVALEPARALQACSK